MKISQFNKNTIITNSDLTFKGNNTGITREENAKLAKQALATHKEIRKELAKYKGKTIPESVAVNLEKRAKDLFESIKSVEETAKKDIGKINIPSIMVKIVRWFGKIDKTGNKALDTASLLTKIVLWGNVGKEAVGTTLYTVQALTNQDLPEDKRKFVGMYDLAVGVVSTLCSFVFGVGLEKKIKGGYKNLLSPLSNSADKAMRAKSAAAIVGLAAFSSYALQTIVGKRIVAPAIATPIAGKLKKQLEDKEVEVQQGEPILLTKDGFIDLKAKLAKTDKSTENKK